MSVRRVIDCIKKNKRFLIATHTNQEGDALGSELAFYMLLKKMGKSAVILNEDTLPYGYDFLPKADLIKKYKNNIKGISFDCFVVLDCSDLKRTGEVYRINENDPRPILNIDHHISNGRFADVNWVEPGTSCCAEMIYKLYKALNIPIDRQAAICLYVGIMTDTGSFRYSNTSSATHKVVSELLKHDIDIVSICKNINGNIPFEDARALSRILTRVRRAASGRIIWFQIEKGLLSKRKPSFDISEQVLGFARSIKGAEVCCLFKENLGAKDQIRVNFRSQGKVDVNKIAGYFGGGGHKTASGCTINGKLIQVRDRVLAKLKAALR